MRVLELEIQNVRGVRELLLEPNGRNFAIWGPNGSGKSAVVDAIDFLLTGRVARLMGRGTKDLSLREHGPHIDHEPKDAIVRAMIQLPGEHEPVEIKRCMEKPGTLVCKGSKKPQLEPILAIAARGQHVLTRREILKYITAEPSHRAQEIQELLDLSDVEDIRKALVRVQGDFEKDLEAAKRVVATAEGQVMATAQKPRYEHDGILEFTNKNRSVLGGKPITNLRSMGLKTELKAPTAPPEETVMNVQILQRDVDNLLSVEHPEARADVAKTDSQVRQVIRSVKTDPQLEKALARLKLVQLGLKLIDESGKCPLCDTAWPRGKLEAYLQQSLAVAQLAQQHHDRITELSQKVQNRVNATIASVKSVHEAAEHLKVQEALPILQGWLVRLDHLSIALGNPVEKYLESGFESAEVQKLLVPDDLRRLTDKVTSAAKEKCPEATPEQTAWDTLTRLEENLKALEGAQMKLESAMLASNRASMLLLSFVKARDTVLETLYDSVRDRFVELYRELHGSDEAGFKAKIEPAGAGLNFEVDFYGRGKHAPHALHSEGHQDSMGLCLYLALAERLTKGIIDLVILDDVVMSVDAEHRRHLCRLLATSFPGRQFLITTHDKTWANQLKSEGVVRSRELVEFYNWSIEAGPQVGFEPEIWTRINKDLQQHDIPGAAARLRRGSEYFFAMVCDALKASIPYRLDSRWELGDFLPAAMACFRVFLKRAKDAAQSWGHQEAFQELQEIDSTVGGIYKRSQAEQWAINANVHYNNWANFEEADFRPVVEAFEDLYGLFLCAKCKGLLHLATKGMTQVAVRCNCGKVDWNLTRKEDAP